MTRKQFLQAGAATSARAAFPTLDGETAAKRPNILIIMTDQHRRNYMTAAGNPIVPTPNIDRIAQKEFASREPFARIRFVQRRALRC